MKISEYKAIIRPMLSDKRYHHSVCVAKEAVKLARQYGADEKRASQYTFVSTIFSVLTLPLVAQFLC